VQVITLCNGSTAEDLQGHQKKLQTQDSMKYDLKTNDRLGTPAPKDKDKYLEIFQIVTILFETKPASTFFYLAV
jgi:hypothetical protein